jgi:photosystem II stability/assembly factor-like uncharacterized protein
VPSNGPDGGPAFAVAVAPSAPQDVYLGTRNGVFRSTDGGLSWVGAGLVRGTKVTSLEVDPRSPATVYAGLDLKWVDGMSFGRAVYKSTNGGKTWHALTLRGEPLAISPTGVVYAATAGAAGTIGLVSSGDLGRSWQPVDDGLPSTYLWAFAFDPSAPARVYAAMGPRGLFESDGGGAPWRAVDIPRRYGEVTAIAVDPVHPRTLYAGTDAGVAVSRDRGGSWQMLNTTMGAHGRDRWYGEVSALLVDPHDSRSLYATTICAGVFKSMDAGRVWSPVDTGVTTRCARAYSLALVPDAPQTLYAAETDRGVLKSIDGGAHWIVATRGLAAMPVASLAVDPRSPGTVYAGTRALGLFESIDGGAGWRRLATGHGRVVSIAVDSSNPQNVLIASPPNGIVRSTDAGRTWTGTTSAPQRVTVVAASNGTAYAGTPRGDLFGSADGGRSWRPLGHTGAFLEALAIDPEHPTVVYAGLDGVTARGLYRSTDGGKSWQQLTRGLDVGVTAVVLDPRDPATVYVGTDAHGVFKSTDRGATWRPGGRGLEPAGDPSNVTALAVDPAQPSTVYAATYGQGVFRSTDGGTSWHPVNDGLADHRVTMLALDATGRMLYAGTAGGGVRSLSLKP